MLVFKLTYLPRKNCVYITCDVPVSNFRYIVKFNTGPTINKFDINDFLETNDEYKYVFTLSKMTHVD